jgi:putative methionine-R-sulfoxide reductase with GAF domain
MNRSIAADLARVADSEAPREERARAAAETIRAAGDYRWVGISDVGDDEIAVIASTGDRRPARARFPLTEGLSGEAVGTRRTAVGDSEAVVPILGAESGIVIGTLHVQSDRAARFSDSELDFLESCAAVLRPLYD